jgi:hypothetical protein
MALVVGWKFNTGEVCDEGERLVGGAMRCANVVGRMGDARRGDEAQNVSLIRPNRRGGARPDQHFMLNYSLKGELGRDFTYAAEN